MMFAKHFVDAPERVARKKTRDIRAMMNLHNNHAGRLVSGANHLAISYAVADSLESLLSCAPTCHTLRHIEKLAAMRR